PQLRARRGGGCRRAGAVRRGRAVLLAAAARVVRWPAARRRRVPCAVPGCQRPAGVGVWRGDPPAGDPARARRGRDRGCGTSGATPARAAWLTQVRLDGLTVGTASVDLEVTRDAAGQHTVEVLRKDSNLTVITDREQRR